MFSYYVCSHLGGIDDGYITHMSTHYFDTLIFGSGSKSGVLPDLTYFEDNGNSEYE